MFPLDIDRLRANARKATTEDLLNRVTVYRSGMEPEEVFLIEEELRSRGLTAEEILDYRERMEREVIFRDGVAARCSFCHAPAVAAAWGWHRLWGLVPLFPRYFYYCREHRPTSRAPIPRPAERVDSGE
jgi:hypothetical protein